MDGVRFKETGMGSSFGGLVYDEVVRESHFLRALDAAIAWPVSTRGRRPRLQLLVLYEGRGQVRRLPYNRVVLLKMLILSYLHNVSERQTETPVNDSLSAKWFLGLAVDEAAPDHSTLTAFKGRIIEQGGEARLNELLDEVIGQAMEAG